MILCLCPNPSIDTYAWMTDFQKGGVNRISRLQEFPGGKGTHVALALAELGAKSELMGAWAGNTGQWIREACKEKGVDSSGSVLLGNNRKCFTFRSENSTFDNSELLEPGPEMTDADWRGFVDSFGSRLPKTDLLCMSGSWPKNAPVNAYQQLLDITAAQNKRVILDCSGEQLEEAMKTGCFGLHLNESEAVRFCGSARLEDLVNKLDGKVELVALTKGADGLELYYKGDVVHAKVTISEVISTVGSGDCLTAGIAYAVSKNLSIEEIASYGVACGAANCLTSDLGMLRKEDVENLLPQVEIQRMS